MDRGPLSRAETLKQRQDERRSFARARLRTSDNVSTFDAVGNDLGLDRRRLLVFLLEDSAHQGYREAQRGER